MTYRLERSESVARGVRRIADDQATRAISELRDPDLDHAVRVHQVRKRVKKLRALLRLVRPAMGKASFHERNDRLRQLNRELAGARDAQVRIETATALAGDHPDLASLGFDTVREYLQLQLETERELAGGDAGPGPIADTLASLRDDIGRWPLDDDGFALISRGLKSAYARGREALDDVLEQPDDEHLHALRKRVKDYAYHTRLLRDAWPAPMKCLVNEASMAAELLGDHHDLAVLGQALVVMPDGLVTDVERAAWGERIRREQARLERQALQIARRLYVEPPKHFVRRRRAYWRVWTDAGS